MQSILRNKERFVLLLEADDVARETLFLEARPLDITNGQAPREVRLFKFGANNTRSYGTLYLTPESARACLEFEAFLGRDLCWDWHHYSEPSGPQAPSNEASGAAAWFSLRVGSDGIYGAIPRRLSASPNDAAKAGVRVPIDGIGWLPPGRADVESLRFRHFSPGVQIAIDPNTKQKIIVGITSCALTNSPETLDQSPLLCSTPKDNRKMNWEQILAALTARGASQAEIDQAKADFDSAAAQPTAVNLTTPASPAPADVTERRRLVMLAYRNRFLQAEIPSLEQMAPEVLEANLSVRPVNPLFAPAANPAPRTQPITGGNQPLTAAGLPWEQLNYRNRHALYESDRPHFEAMLSQVKDQKRRECLLASPELATQPLLLATGTTTATTISTMIPQVLNQALEAGIAGLRAFDGSPVVMYDGSMPEFDLGTGQKIKGGSVITIPTYTAIGAMIDADSESDPTANTQRLDSSSVTATVFHGLIGAELTYSSQAFAGALQDPYVEVARQINTQGKNYIEDKLVVEAKTTDLAATIIAVGDGLLTFDCFVDLLALWGDEEFAANGSSMAMAFLHSNSLKQLRKIKDSTGRPIFYEPSDGGVPSLLGKPVKITDRMLVDGSSNNVLLLAKPRSLAVYVNERKFKLDTFHDVRKDTDLTYLHCYAAVKLWPRVPGYSKKGVLKLTHKP